MADRMTEWEIRFDALASGKAEPDQAEIERLRAGVREGWAVMSEERLMAIAGLFGTIERLKLCGGPEAPFVAAENVRLRAENERLRAEVIRERSNGDQLATNSLEEHGRLRAEVGRLTAERIEDDDRWTSMESALAEAVGLDPDDTNVTLDDMLAEARKHRADAERLTEHAEIGRQWCEDSSLKRWFPITAEDLERLTAERDELEANVDRERQARERVEGERDAQAVALRNLGKLARAASVDLRSIEDEVAAASAYRADVVRLCLQAQAALFDGDRAVAEYRKWLVIAGRDPNEQPTTAIIWLASERDMYRKKADDLDSLATSIAIERDLADLKQIRAECELADAAQAREAAERWASRWKESARALRHKAIEAQCEVATALAGLDSNRNAVRMQHQKRVDRLLARIEAEQSARDAAEHRVAELTNAIREHCERQGRGFMRAEGGQLWEGARGFAEVHFGPGLAASVYGDATSEPTLDELWPPCGPCGFCGGLDKRHRVWDAIANRHAAGESIESLAADYDVTEAHIRAAIEHGVVEAVGPDAGDCEACGDPMDAEDVREAGPVRVHRACAESLGPVEVAALANEHDWRPDRLRVMSTAISCLTRVWRERPELRLGQLLVVATGNSPESGRLFYRDDVVLTNDLREFSCVHENRNQSNETGDQQPMGGDHR